MVNYSDTIPVFKALADETRLRIIEMLSCGELCACKILESFHITQPTLSYHMKTLTECDLVANRREGAWMHYSLNREKMEQLSAFLRGISSGGLDCICHSKGGEGE